MEWQTALEQSDALATWFQLWIEGFVEVLAAILVTGVAAAMVGVIVVAWMSPTARRRFRCADADREVEVLFERRGLARRLAAVASCSVFEAGTPVACGRQCLDAAYRRQWKPARSRRLTETHAA